MMQKNLENIIKKRLLSDPDYCLTNRGMTELICSSCEFYKEGEDEELACGAFNILQRLIEKKAVTIEEIIDALKE